MSGPQVALQNRSRQASQGAGDRDADIIAVTIKLVVGRLTAHELRVVEEICQLAGFRTKFRYRFMLLASSVKVALRFGVRPPSDRA